MMLEEKIRKFLRENIGYIIVFIVAVAYISTAFIDMGKTGKTVEQIFGDGAVVFFLGLFITRVFDLQGMINGERDERVQSTLLLHLEIVERITLHIDELDRWCEEKNKEALKDVRTKILAREGMKYSDYFEDDGLPKEYMPDASKAKDSYARAILKKRAKAYRRALRLKLTPITAGDLTSEGGRNTDPLYLGRTKTDYERSGGISDVVTKVGTAFLFGYYGVELVADFSYAELIWSILQVCVFLIMGVIKMYKSYIFMVDEYRSRVIKKIDNLQKFENSIKKQTGEVTNGKI